jgi:hypothetical protein
MPVGTSQGTTVTFDGDELGRVVSVSGSFSSPHKEIRPLDVGVDVDTGQYLPVFEQTLCEQQVDIEAMTTAFSFSVVGAKGQLAVSGTGWFLNFGIAICENVKLTAKVGDVLRISYTFRRSAG